MERYERHIGALTPEEDQGLRLKKAAVIGCGGLGGFIIEYLARIGIGEITAIDGDTFVASNLNRQLLSEESNMGKKKALAAAARVKQINSTVKVNPVCENFTAENGRALLEGCHIVMDGLDNIGARLLAADIAGSLGIPFIHGAIDGFYVQCALVMPGNTLLHKIYGPLAHKAADMKRPSSFSFTPAFCASLQVCEGLKYLCGRKSPLENKLLTYDMLQNTNDIISLA